MPQSEYIAFLDETGDHSLITIDSNYPVFGVAALICRRDDYIKQIIPAISAFKHEYFGHEGAILRSYDIRKKRGPFKSLFNGGVRASFMSDISNLMSYLPYTLFYFGIHKLDHSKKYRIPDNPYDLAMEMGLERLHRFCRNNAITQLPIIAESRGDNEDDELRLSFYKFLSKGTRYATPSQLAACGLDLLFASKKNNVVGLQIADLCAYPLGSHHARGYTGPDYHIARGKIYRQGGNLLGLKFFP